MTNRNSFGIVGGDQRQIALAESIAADGYMVYTHGFDRAPPVKGVKEVGLEELAERCDTVILPVPVTADGKKLNAPFSSRGIPLDDYFAGFMVGKAVYGGMMGRLFPTSSLWEEVDCNDYFIREEFAIRNAVPTAEGAIEIAIRESKDVLHGKKVLVTGYGNIGKVLSWMLKGIGADVWVSARKTKDLAWIQVFGYHPVNTEELPGNQEFSVVFNTIPAVVFTAKVLKGLSTQTKIIDLASAPGGVDLDAAEKLGIPVLQALSLPGKVAPVEAGRIIKDTIYSMMEE